MTIETLAGLCSLGAVGLLVVGGVLYGQIGSAVTSGASGEAALARIAETGNRFAVVNACFHLSPLLILPAIVVLFRDLAAVRPGEVAIGTLIGLIGFSVPIAVVFPLNVSLVRLAGRYAAADPQTRATLALAADANLATQVGGEFVQSAFGGLWVLAMSAAMLVSPAWPAWLGYLGMAGGVGMVAAGFASLLGRVPGLGRVLGSVGAVGILLLVIWAVGVAWRMLTAS